MPTYNYKCDVCGTYHEAIRPISKRDDGPWCCDGMTRKVIKSAPMVEATFLGSAANPGYVSPLTGNFIDSKRARNNEMREHNVVPKE